MYLDDAIIARQFRVRFDAAFDNPVPDRAEFFYGQCGCFNNVVNPPSPPAPGPPLAETRVDYQDVSMYLELAPRHRFSAFVEIPIRAINPDVNANESGLSDITTGFKLGLIACEDRYCTFQFKIYTPTGDAFQGLGTGHASLEPGMLFYRRLGQRLTWNAEIRHWIPLSESNVNDRLFAGNVLRYGAGLGYDIWQENPDCCERYCCNYNRNCRRLTLMTEFVGWSVLSGLQSGLGPDGTDDADGTEIFNAKVGLRYTMTGGGSIGFSYGRALTDDTWYSDIARLEYRLMF